MNDTLTFVQSLEVVEVDILIPQFDLTLKHIGLEKRCRGQIYKF